MRCTVHIAREAAGYCTGCGSFYCVECLKLCDDGRKYCDVCMRKLGKQQKVEAAARDARLAVKLMVRFKNASVIRGTTYKLDQDRSSFQLIRHGGKSHGEEVTVNWSETAYVAMVESFTEKRRTRPDEYRPNGSEITVTLVDGEVISGFTLKHYSDKDPRFSVIPGDPNDNRISLIVERSAVKRMSLGRIPKAQELRKLVDNSVRRLILHYHWKHPDIVVTLDELAARIERTAAAVERELEEFEREGLVSRIGAANGKQLKFTPSKDPVVRQTLATMGKEIETLYFRRRKSGGEAGPATGRYGTHTQPGS